MVNDFLQSYGALVITTIWPNRCGNYFTVERGNVRHSCHAMRNAYSRVCVSARARVCVCADFKRRERNYAIR